MRGSRDTFGPSNMWAEGPEVWNQHEDRLVLILDGEYGVGRR
jgi:hypothetical protein